MMENGDKTWSVKKSYFARVFPGSSSWGSTSPLPVLWWSVVGMPFPIKEETLISSICRFPWCKSSHQPTISKGRVGKRLCTHCVCSLLKRSLGFLWPLDKPWRPGTTEKTHVLFCGRTHCKGEGGALLPTTQWWNASATRLFLITKWWQLNIFPDSAANSFLT